VCALCIEKKKKILQEGVKRENINVSSVIFHFAVWGVFWNTSNSVMWRCKIRRVDYYMNTFITNKLRKDSSFYLFYFNCYDFSLEGRPVSSVDRKLKCPLKKTQLLAQAVGI
jgi:hypothetical protein